VIHLLDELWHTGRLVALHPVAAPETSIDAIANWLSRAEAEYRNQLPSVPPALDLSSAVWAAQQFYRAAQLMVYQELGDEFILTGLETEPTDDSRFSDADKAPEIASIHYSVDLLFRFLPDLERLTKAASSTDPLLKQIDAWAERWPLSSARMKRPAEIQEKMEPILRDRCLRIMYIERVLDGGPVSADEADRWNKINAEYEWKTFDRQR